MKIVKMFAIINFRHMPVEEITEGDIPNSWVLGTYPSAGDAEDELATLADKESYRVVPVY